MPPPSGGNSGAVEARLRRLDASACAAFVADLWAARGYVTRPEGDVVLATRRGRSQVLYPLATRRIGSPRRPDRPIDVVVDPRGREVAREIAAAHDARVVDAGALREVLWYGVDRPTAADLCDRHLGAPPDDLRPPLADRVRERAGAVSPPGAATLAGAVAILVVGAFVTTGMSGLDAARPDAIGEIDRAPTASEPAGTPVTEAITTGSAAPAWRTGPEAVPGLDDDGIRDLFVLTVAHRRALWDRSYTLWIDYHGPPRGPSNATRVHRDTDVVVDDERYLAVTSVATEGRAGGGDDGYGETAEVVYRVGDDRYVAGSLDATASYRRTDDAAPPHPVDPDEAYRTVVRRYLSTPETTVEGPIRGNGGVHYRVVGRGAPVGLARPVRNYTVVAFVSQEGVITDLTATYTVSVDGRSASVRREWTYGRFDETRVDPPAWYERQSGGNATGVTAAAA